MLSSTSHQYLNSEEEMTSREGRYNAMDGQLNYIVR
jgi:hypothetical protein